VHVSGRDRDLNEMVRATVERDPDRWGRCRERDARHVVGEEVARETLDVGLGGTERVLPQDARPRSAVSRCLQANLRAIVPGWMQRTAPLRHVAVVLRFKVRPPPAPGVRAEGP
jgi:hypothetical protein